MMLPPESVLVKGGPEAMSQEIGHTDKVAVKLGLPSIRGEDEAGESGVSVLTCVEVLAGEIQEWNSVLRSLGLRVVLDIRIEAVPKEGSE